MHVKDILLKLSLRSTLMVHNFIKKLKYNIGNMKLKENIVNILDDQAYFFN